MAKEKTSYYDKTAKTYDEKFTMLYYRVYDAITWKYLEQYIPEGSWLSDSRRGRRNWALDYAHCTQKP